MGVTPPGSYSASVRRPDVLGLVGVNGRAVERLLRSSLLQDELVIAGNRQTVLLAGVAD